MKGAGDKAFWYFIMRDFLSNDYLVLVETSVQFMMLGSLERTLLSSTTSLQKNTA
jgi:hypothetical protein